MFQETHVGEQRRCLHGFSYVFNHIFHALACGIFVTVGFGRLDVPFAIEQALSARRARRSLGCPPPQSDLRLIVIPSAAR
jgi:hypothetical protein